jgi:3-dehydroquinate synthase
LKENKYSKNIIIIVDNNTNEYCTTISPFLETDLTIEIIEFDSESKIKILRLASKFGMSSRNLVPIEVSNHQFRGGVVTDLGVCSFHLQTRGRFYPHSNYLIIDG